MGGNTVKLFSFTDLKEMNSRIGPSVYEIPKTIDTVHEG